jgi:hypothetical protein
MATLDKWHFLSTCKVRTCPSHDFLNMFYEKKKPNQNTTYSPIVIIPRTTLFIYNFFESIWNKNIFDNNMILNLF